ncbi:hypothetical protein TKK_0003905 [Trichogramma kaykai]|uniref:DUF4371 domain-containing protein n=1 Tax=Trichogramma kaykai TaxID=54128 RepID=A0ABD2XNK1_9HYME
MKKNENLPAKRRTRYLQKKEADYFNSLHSTIFDISKKITYNHTNRNNNNNDDAVSNISSQFSQISVQDVQSEDDYEPASKRIKKEFNSSLLASTLDRCAISDRQAALILNAIDMDQGNEEQPISKIRSSVRRKRASVRNSIETNVENLTFSPLTVHWDGKCVKKKDKTKVELLPVVVSSGSDEQLLFCASLKHGTGENISNAVLQSLEKWGISDIKSMCYDTTSSNTGRLIGACKLLEDKLKKPLLHASCRHHISELVLGTAFDICFPSKSKSPEIDIFIDFRDNKWDNIDKTKFHTASTIRRKALKTMITQKKDEASECIRNLLALGNQVRADYDELHLILPHVFKL